MIVFISDLHISDGTVATFNLPVAAFTGVLKDLNGHLEGSPDKRLHLVLLGDIFELIQTKHWMCVDSEGRMWDEGPPREQVERALGKIFRKNPCIFDLFKGGLQQHLCHASKVEVTYVPGNHDRLCNLYPSTREMVTEHLELERDDPGAPFDWEFFDEEHRVFARHGHEYDIWNYTGGYDLTPEAHEKTPIGDVITAMLAARVPYEVHERLEGAMGECELRRVSASLGAMFDVRPQAALIAWLGRHVQDLKQDKYRTAVEESIDQSVRGFLRIRFVREWLDEHLRDGLKLEALLRSVLALDVLRVRRHLVDAVSKRARPTEEDPYVEEAAGELARLRQCESRERTRCIVYGHTHTPKQVPLTVAGGPDRPHDTLYMNSGTWRPRWEETADRQGFVGMKGLTYTIIYAPSEDPGQKSPQIAEAWTGMLKDGDVEAGSRWEET